MFFENLQELLSEEILELYNAEIQYLKTLQKGIKTAHSDELKQEFRILHDETKNQITRLEETLNQLGIAKEARQTLEIDTLLKKMNTLLDNHDQTALFDAALIGTSQKIAHYLIAAYGTARTYAKHLDLDDTADLLQDNLNETANGDKKLTKIAEGSFLSSGINKEALTAAGSAKKSSS